MFFHRLHPLLLRPHLHLPERVPQPQQPSPSGRCALLQHQGPLPESACVGRRAGIHLARPVGVPEQAIRAARRGAGGPLPAGRPTDRGASAHGPPEAVAFLQHARGVHRLDDRLRGRAGASGADHHPEVAHAQARTAGRGRRSAVRVHRRREHLHDHRLEALAGSGPLHASAVLQRAEHIRERLRPAARRVRTAMELQNAAHAPQGRAGPEGQAGCRLHKGHHGHGLRTLRPDIPRARGAHVPGGGQRLPEPRRASFTWPWGR